MKRLVLSPLVLVTALASPGAAWAQEATTIGDRLNAILKDITGPFIFLISLLCLVGGIWLLAKGLIKLREAAGNGQQSTGAIAIIVAAAFLIALPEAAGTGMLTLTGEQSGIINNQDIAAAKIGLDDTTAGGSFDTPTASVGAVTDCYNAAEPVPCMADNVARNVVPIGIIAVFVVVFISGLWGLGHCLFDLTKLETGRGVPDGWWGRLIFNVVLLNASIIFQIVSQTVLGNPGTVTGDGLAGGSLLEYSVGAGSNFKQYEELIGHVFTILALFGAIAFVRGIFVCKAAGEGRQGGTYAHGIVFIVAGILLANSKISTCLVLNTMLGAASSTLGFCA